MKIFGREPAIYIGAIEAIIALLVTFNFSGLSNAQAGVIVALVVAIGGLVTAFATKDALLAAITGVVKAALIVGVAYGLHISQEQMGLVLGIVAALGAAYVRTQTAPVATPISAE